MSQQTLFRVVAGMIALSAGLAFTPAGAQTLKIDPIISTTCGAGVLEKCGTQPTHESCGFSFGLSPIPGLPFPGITFSWAGCKGNGTRDIYKDYKRTTSSVPTTGVCVGVPKFPTDPQKDDDAESPVPSGDESC
jgi:hypothetical protein